MLKSTIPKMYVCYMPLDEGVAMSPKGVELAVSSMMESIQILCDIFKKSVVKAEFQDIPNFLDRSKSSQDLYKVNFTNCFSNLYDGRHSLPHQK